MGLSEYKISFHIVACSHPSLSSSSAYCLVSVSSPFLCECTARHPGNAKQPSNRGQKGFGSLGCCWSERRCRAALQPLFWSRPFSNRIKCNQDSATRVSCFALPRFSFPCWPSHPGCNQCLVFSRAFLQGLHCAWEHAKAYMHTHTHINK